MLAALCQWRPSTWTIIILPALLAPVHAISGCDRSRRRVDFSSKVGANHGRVGFGGFEDIILKVTPLALAVIEEGLNLIEGGSGDYGSRRFNSWGGLG